MNIYKRGKTWTYVIEGPYVGGKRNRITKGGFKTKKEAQKEATAKEHELNVTGKLFKDTNLLFKEVVEQFLEYYKNTVRNTTFYNVNSMVNKINNYFGDYKIKDITVLDIQNFVNELEKENLKPGYIKEIIAKLKLIYNFTKDIAELIYMTPNFKKVKLPKNKVKVRNDILTEDEIQQALEVADGTIYYYLIQLAIITGARRGELLALTWDNIDLKNQVIHIRNNLTPFNKLTPPKNYASIRDLNFGKKTLDILLELKFFTKKKHSYTLDENNNIELSYEPDLDFIFRNPDGGFLTTDNVHYYFYRYQTCHMHQFRHYNATQLINNGIPIAEVSRRLGHSQIKTTLNIYVGQNQKISKDNINKIESIFDNKLTTNKKRSLQL
ncbi:MAG: site-specific integrase [Prevotellaceae bacterium]|nr:site-specific integrase [Prevotellaceae bacterium]